MSENAEYGLVMPFVIVESEGGPYPDQPFVAGYALGRLDGLLEACPAIHEAWMHPDALPQVDLIAMHHGYTLTSEPWDEHPDEWIAVTLTRLTPPHPVQEQQS